jgi:DNA segregation ATPase FtsK/SpoIIIE, S-DNA-T family
VPGHRPPGRALVGEEALECQLALPRGLPDDARPAATGVPPLRIIELPADPLMSARCPTAERSDSLILPIGPGGDEGSTREIDLLRTRGLLVAGPPGSGRSSALDAFTSSLCGAGTPVLRIGRRHGPGSGAPDGPSWVDPFDEVGVRAWLAGLDGRPGVAVADDVGSPMEWPALSALATPAGGRGGILLAAAHAGQLSAHFQGPVAALRRSRTGLLLCPGPGDADLLGVRLPRTPVPVRPGSGWLVTGGTVERIQVARRRPHDPAPAG